MDVFNEVIDYESKNIKKLYKEGKVTQFLKKQTKAISSKLRPIGFKRYEYTQIDGFLATINTETKCWTCRFFNDKAICKHLVAACMNDDVELYGLKAKSNQFKTLRRRIARQVDDSILDELDEVVDDVANIEEVNAVNDDANIVSA